MALIGIFVVGKIDPKPEQRMGQFRSKPSMKFRHLEYFVAAAEELNFTHAAGVPRPPDFDTPAHIKHVRIQFAQR